MGGSVLLAVGALQALFTVGLLAQAAAAALCGMRVERWTFGVGRPLLRAGRFQLALLPLGGTVRVAGLHPTEQPVATDDPRAFHNRPLALRLLYMLAWPLGVFLCLVAFSAAGAALVGVETPVPGVVVQEVLDGTPAEDAGLRAGDVVTRMDGVVVSPMGLRDAVQASQGRPLRVELERDGRRVELELTPAGGDDGRWRVGIRPAHRTAITRTALPRAAVVGLNVTWSNLVAIAAALPALARDSEARIVGPVGLASVVQRDEAVLALQLLAVVGAGLIFMALLPLFPFAGGRFVAVLLGWRSRRRRAPHTAVDAGAVVIERGRFPLPLVAALLPQVASSVLVISTLEVETVIAGAIGLLLPLALALGEPRAWMAGIVVPFVSLPHALSGASGSEKPLFAAALLLVPAVLVLAPVRRWFRMTCPVCGRLAARPVASSPRSSCVACGSSFTRR